jgi:hypothetical protein
MLENLHLRVRQAKRQLFCILFSDQWLISEQEETMGNDLYLPLQILLQR